MGAGRGTTPFSRCTVLWNLALTEAQQLLGEG